MNKIFAIYGASGYGKEVMPLIREQLSQNSTLIFIDDAVKESNTLLGYQILSFEEYLKLDGKKYVTIAIANSQIREKLTLKCLEHNIELFDVKANNVVELDSIQIGPGYILSPFVTITSNIKIGNSFQANIYSYVAHDCIIGNYVTFAPAVKCNGNIHIEDHVYIGTGAIIHQGKPNKPLTIGQGAIIAAGAVVTKSVPAGMTVFGNPAIKFTKENIKRRM
jgi:sugar O-acyltransferase (sialic acid O-acetyltransferase NeuD family)